MVLNNYFKIDMPASLREREIILCSAVLCFVCGMPNAILCVSICVYL